MASNTPISAFINNESDQRYNSGMTVHEKFVEDMRSAGIVTEFILVDSFGKVLPPVPINKMVQHFRKLSSSQQCLFSGIGWIQNYMVYPIGKAKAGWNDAGADSEGEEVERDGYKDAYAAKAPKDGDEEEDG